MGQRMDCFRPLSGGTKSVSCSTSSPPPMRPLPGKFISFHLGLCWLTWPVLERPLRGGGGGSGTLPPRLRIHPGWPPVPADLFSDNFGKGGDRSDPRSSLRHFPRLVVVPMVLVLLLLLPFGPAGPALDLMHRPGQTDRTRYVHWRRDVVVIEGFMVNLCQVFRTRFFSWAFLLFFPCLTTN